MHELGLSEGILRAALATPRVTRRNLRGLTVKVGALSGASVSALEFCLNVVLEDGDMTDVQVRVEEAPARLRCDCGHEYSPPSIFEGCPKCGGFDREVLDGQDVTLESIEVDDGEDQGQASGAGP